jgi:hypothetical protein
MHVLTHLAAQTPPVPAGGPDLSEFKGVVGHLVVLILAAALVSVVALVCIHGWQHMTGGEEGAAKAKKGFHRLFVGLGIIVFATPIAGLVYWVFGSAITKALNGG